MLRFSSEDCAREPPFAEKSRKSRGLAWQDQLTKLPNSLTSVNVWPQCSQRRQGAAPVALLLFEIDGFKSVNDTLGTRRGTVASEIAERVGRRVRQADTLQGSAATSRDPHGLAHGKSDAVAVAETVLAAIGEIDMFSPNRVCGSAPASASPAATSLQPGNDSPTNCS